MTKPMTKAQLVAALADEMGADKKTASAALETTLSMAANLPAGAEAMALMDVWL